jgi:UDP:flavonoid glycosyltransferase YjiC (YdhE family)
MRVLFMASPAATHLMVMAPLAWALRAGGDQVLVASQPDTVAAARGCGLSTVIVGPEHREVDRWRKRRDSGISPAAAGPPWEYLRAEWRERAAQTCPRAIEVARAWQPDLLVADPLEFTALLVGGLLGIPVVQHRWGVDLIAAERHMHMRAALREVCRDLGLPGGRLPEPALVLDPCPPRLRVPGVAPGAPIRAIPSNGAGVRPGWAADGRRRVCVSLGNRTLRMGGLPLLATIIAACAGLVGTETVITAAPEACGGLADLPPSVRLVGHVPLDLFLPGCQAVVQHGGWGTALTAMALGVPQVTVPRLPYQAEVGERIAAAGAGVCVSPAGEAGEASTEQVTAAVEAVLNQQRYRDGARALRDEAAAMPHPADVARSLRDLAGRT